MAPDRERDRRKCCQVTVRRNAQLNGCDNEVSEAVRRMAARVPTHVTLKDVKKRLGKAQEDIYPVAKFEKLWVDVTALPDLRCAYLAVPRARGQQLEDVAQLDDWLRDGSADYVASPCDWRVN